MTMWRRRSVVLVSNRIVQEVNGHRGIPVGSGPNLAVRVTARLLLPVYDVWKIIIILLITSDTFMH